MEATLPGWSFGRGRGGALATAVAVLAVKCIRVSSTSTLARLAGGGREDGDIGGSGP